MTTLFDRLGREGGIEKAVAEFYQRVAADGELRHYFEGLDLTRLRRHQVAFLVAATGGVQRYAGADIGAVHGALDITPGDFDRVVEHLIWTLRDLGVEDGAVGEVVGALAPLRDVIIAA
jgi:hemoglobin